MHVYICVYIYLYVCIICIYILLLLKEELRYYHNATPTKNKKLQSISSGGTSQWCSKVV